MGLKCNKNDVNNGGAEGNRTPDLVIANDALYQLSYGPNCGQDRKWGPKKSIAGVSQA